MRLAFFSPLPPAPTGIADYSIDVLRQLAPSHEIDVFHDQSEIDASALPRGVRAFPVAAWDDRHRERAYDLPIYQMGNAPAHLYMYPILARASGLLVLHELVLHHARAKAFLDGAEARAYRAATGDPKKRAAAERRIDEYRAELEYSHPGRGASIAEAQLNTTGDLLPYAYPLFRLPAEASRLVACHSAFMTSAVAEALADVATAHIQMMMTASPVDRAAVRAVRERHGIADGEIVIATFGLLTREKRIETVARAVARASAHEPRLRLMLVGDVPERAALDRMLADVGVSGRTIVTGRVSFEDLAPHIEAADVVAHLRYPTGRETSAALLRVLAQGRAAAVSALEHLADIPEDAIVRVSVDDEEGDLLRAILRLAADPSGREQMGRRAADFVKSAHSPEHCGRAYEEAIARAAALPPSRPRPGWPAHWVTTR